MIPLKKRGPVNTIESLAGDLPPGMLLLAAMLENQIMELAMLRARGMWSVSPAELGDSLRNYPGGTGGNYEMTVAVWEWMLWGRATEALLSALEEETPIRIDRARIVSLAVRRSEAGAGDGRRRTRRTMGRRAAEVRSPLSFVLGRDAGAVGREGAAA